MVDPLDAAIEQFERARDLRDEGDDNAAFDLTTAILATIENVSDESAAVVRAQLAILRAEIATRLYPVERSIELGETAVDLARRARRSEPVLRCSRK